jgi:hypothetical protein
MENKSYSVGECEPLTKMNTDWLLKLLLIESSNLGTKSIVDKSDCDEFEKEAVIAAIITKRILAIGAKFTVSAVLFGSLICDRPGYAVIYLIDVLNTLGLGTDEEPITLKQICEKVYPNGFRTEKSLHSTIDDIKSRGKEHSKFAYLY